jgi:hypothetical protein
MSKIIKEEWKPIKWKGVDYTGLYEVSNTGKVRSLDRIIKKGNGNCRLKGKLMGSVDSLGYVCVTLSKEGFRKNIYVHSIVSEIFNRPLRKNEVVDHIISRQHNAINEIRILTKRQNSSIEKTIKSGLPVGVHKIKNAKYRPYISNIQANKKSVNLGTYVTIRDASKAYYIALQLILRCNTISPNKIKQKINEYRKGLDLKPIKI